MILFNRRFRFSLLLFLAAQLFLILAAAEQDLYSLLGVSRTASTKEVKQAYRRKARDTHPDKNKGIPPEEAAEAFRKVVHAFEILSDDSSRRRYDRTGRADQGSSSSGSSSRGGGGGFQQGGFRWTFHRHRPVRLKDKFEVQEAQSRVLHVVSLEQLRTVMLDDDDFLERNLLMCFVTPGQVERHADDEMVFPYPFAAMSSQGIWWEDLLQTVTIRFHNGNDLQRFFNVPSGDEMRKSGKPIFLFGKKGQPLSPDFARLQTANRMEFEQWVWKQIEISVQFTNHHAHAVEIYWIHGNRAHHKMTIQPKESQWHTSMLSHEWLARDARVDRFQSSPGRYRLSKESSLNSWKIGASGECPDVSEDGKIYIVIEPQSCFDLSGHCGFWNQQGECKKNKRFMIEHCAKTCKGCKPENKSDDDGSDEL